MKEVLEIGDYLGLPHHLVHKTPIDGLKTNEDGSYVTDERIEQLHARGVAKRQMGVYEKLDYEKPTTTKGEKA